MWARRDGAGARRSPSTARKARTWTGAVHEGVRNAGPVTPQRPPPAQRTLTGKPGPAHFTHRQVPAPSTLRGGPLLGGAVVATPAGEPPWSLDERHLPGRSRSVAWRSIPHTKPEQRDAAGGQEGGSAETGWGPGSRSGARMGRSQCSVLAPGSGGIGFEGTTTIFGRRGAGETAGAVPARRQAHQPRGGLTNEEA